MIVQNNKKKQRNYTSWLTTLTLNISITLHLSRVAR